MITALAVREGPGEVANVGSTLVNAFLAGRNEHTLRAYSRDLKDFREFLGAADLDAASVQLLAGTHGEANGIALAYRNHLTESGLAPATVNRRLAAVRSLVRLARTLGMVPWFIEIAGVDAQAYRDTRGPGVEGFRQLLDQCQGDHPKGLRDRAILRLLFDLGLRRGEVCRMELEDVDLEGSVVAILGKKRTQKELRTLPEPTRDALVEWIQARGSEPGPLFVNFSRAHERERLTPTGLTVLVKALGKRAGLKVTPHGLRHAAITAALDLTKGDVRAVQKFSRHRDVRVLNVYDDARRDLAGEVAKLVADAA